MALTFAKVYDAAGIQGTIRETFYDITFDSSYPTGGEAISPVDVGLFNVYAINAIGGNAAAAGYRFWWDTANNKMLVYFASGGGNLSGSVVVKGGGIGEAIGINPDSNAGVLSKAAATDRTIPIATFLGATIGTSGSTGTQFTNGGDLSAVTIRVRCVGV